MRTVGFKRNYGFYDWKLRSGLLRKLGQPRRPAITGKDLVGDITQLGRGVRGLSLQIKKHTIRCYASTQETGCQMKRFVQFIFLLLFAGLIVTGCLFVRVPSPEELRALDQPPSDIAAKVENLLPRVLEWYTTVETELLPQGRLLSETEMKIARQLGVIRPESVRIIVLEIFPMPEDRVLRAEAERYGLGSAAEGARAIGYVIMLKPRYAKSSMIIAHELVHVSQHDRLGRAAFLRRYITEMEMLGYSRSPLEIEAYQKQRVAH